jgi:hypothetical protein
MSVFKNMFYRENVIINDRSGDKPLLGATINSRNHRFIDICCTLLEWVGIMRPQWSQIDYNVSLLFLWQTEDRFGIWWCVNKNVSLRGQAAQIGTYALCRSDERNLYISGRCRSAIVKDGSEFPTVSPGDAPREFDFLKFTNKNKSPLYRFESDAAIFVSLIHSDKLAFKNSSLFFRRIVRFSNSSPSVRMGPKDSPSCDPGSDEKRDDGQPLALALKTFMAFTLFVVSLMLSRYAVYYCHDRSDALYVFFVLLAFVSMFGGVLLLGRFFGFFSDSPLCHTNLV